MAEGSDLLQKLLVTFQGEAEDHLKALGSLLLSLEKEADTEERKRLVENLFRRMHTLKGAAHAVNLLDVAEVCQALETVLADLKRGELALDAKLLDLLHREVNGLEQWIFPGCGEAFAAAPANSPTPIAPVAAAEPVVPSTAHAAAVAAAGAVAAPPTARPESVGRGGEAPLKEGTAPTSGPEARKAESSPDAETVPGTGATVASRSVPAEALQPVKGETVRVPVRLLESLLLQAEELVSAKLNFATLVETLSRLAEDETPVQRDAAELRRRPSADLELQLREAAERETRLRQKLALLAKGGQRSLWALGGMVDGLLEDMRELQLLPFSSLTDTLPRLVRELARDLGKEADLVISGGELEIDRRILAELKEPLIHLVRNVVDHGIEPPAQREEAEKPRRGKILLAIRHLDGNRAEITLRDDGRGIDPGRVKSAALRMEVITPEQAQGLSDADALQLIFESGLSTSSMITSISGRGLGLAIVRECVEKLGGHVTVSSVPGEGAVFRLILPLNFAMIGALLVEVAGRSCLIPAACVELSLRVPAAEVRTVENRETVAVEGRIVSVARLARILELPEAEEPPPLQQLVVVSAADRTLALAVDAIEGVQEVLVKPLGPQLARVRNVSGATVLGSGAVVPILNVNDLFRSALSASTGPAASPGPRTRQLSVLVAEDSITSRTLLKNILEGAGFTVRTAVDGADALAQLKSEEVDVVVSDVEMPRMDGFDLTRAIRAEQRLASLPVILVTGLESREDRERGIEVGADAYIVKSSFDQGGLVEVIRKLS